jgi:rRNA maturation protein Nop10
MSARILSFDIETAPLKGYFWRIWKENIGINQLVDEWSMLTWAAKWLGEDDIYYDSVHLHSDDPSEDTPILESLWHLLDEADMVVAHNGNRFDIPKVNTRFLKAGITPPSPYKRIDTFQVAKRQFAFTSNRLDSLGKFLGLGEKVNTGGFELWARCMEGDKDAFEKMVEYNIGDVQLLEDVYLALRPWMPNHPNVGVYLDSELPTCPKCGSHSVQARGFAYTQVGKYQRYRCNDCGGWSRGRYTVLDKPVREALRTNAN